MIKQRETSVKIITACVFIATFMTAVEGTLGIFNLFINKCYDDTYLREVSR